MRGKVEVDSNLQHMILDSIIDDLEHECSSVDHPDGAKGIFDDRSWVLIRGSNTEHSMRVSVESKDEEKVRSLYKRYEQKIGEDLELIKNPSLKRE